VLDALTSSAAGAVAVVGAADITLGAMTSAGAPLDVEAEEYDGEVYSVVIGDMRRQRVVIAEPARCSVVLADMRRQSVVIAEPEAISVVLADMRVQTVRLGYSIRRTSGAAAVTLGALTSSGAAVLGVDVYDDMNALVTDDLLEQVTHGIA
jgi:hypothetical protein